MVLCRTLFFLAPALAVLTPVRAGAQQTYFVSPNGNDSTGNGSPTQPWATIGHAVAAIPDNGSEIVVRDGIYTGRIRISRQFQTTVVIRAENPYQVRLQDPSTNQRVIAVFGGANFVLEGFEITRPSPSATAALIIQIQQENGRLSENITLRNNIIHDSYNNDLLKINNGCRNITVEGNLFYNQQGSDEHIDINGVEDVVVQDNIFFNDFAGSGRTNGNDTSSFIVIKNSASLPFGKGFLVRRNVFLNWEGSTGSNFLLLGEDGKPFHEAEDVVAENNLMIGNSPHRMRSPFGVKGGKNVTFRNNTVTGDLPANSFAMRLNREGSNPVNEDIRFYNNIWSDPTGTMGDFSDGSPSESTGVVIDNNVYWNNGNAVPTDGDVVNISDDPRALVGNPALPTPVAITLPRWTGGGFVSGSSTIRAEFERLVNSYGAITASSIAIDRSDPLHTPADDILGRPRGSQPDIGAYELGAGSSCDLNTDSTIDEQDVQLAIDQTIGKTPCGSADITQDGSCNIVDVQTIVNASIGKGCAAGP